MPNLRVISDNAIDRAALTASTAAAGFPASNLLLQRKSDTWRSTGTTARLGATWASPETLQGVALPYTDLSPTATIRVRATSEAQMTNLLSATTDFTNAAWTKTNMSTTTGVAGPDGTASACTMTATAGGATITQNVTVTPANFASSFYIRRRTGSGTIYIRNAANSGWAAVPVSASWTRVANDGGATGSTASASIQVSTSGDAIDLAFPQLEAGSVATSYYAGTRPLGYIDSWQSYSYDSGNVLACPAPAVSLRGFTAAQAASAYAFGGGATARHWMTSAVQAYGLAVDIVDTNNLLGYIEASHLVAGARWETATNFDYGASAQLIDSSKNERNDAGDLVTDAGTVSKKVSIPFSKLSPIDRATLWGILRAAGSRYPIYLSMFPEDADVELERTHQVYGKLVQLPAMALPFFKLASATIEVESV